MEYLLEHCPPNPTLEYADSIKVPKKYKTLISRGGGSTIDVGKWVAAKYGLKHIAIPTTAGTGSEVTPYCVLSVNVEKRTFTEDRFIPDGYVLDPRLVTTLPRLHTLASGLDALSQALEAKWSKNATPESNQWANTAIDLIPKNLVKSLNHPEDLTARMNMLLGANFSGRAITITKTNVCHALSYPLTMWYNIPHGLACALSLSYFAKKALNLDLDEFLQSLDLPKYEFDAEKVAKATISSPKLLDYPQPISEGDLFSSLSQSPDRRAH